MAEKLSITIALSGAEEIKRQLEGIGEAGQRAFADINDAAAKVGGFNKLDPSVVTDKMVKFGVLGKDAIDKVNSAVMQAGRMETLVNGLTGVENGLVKVQTAASAVDAVFAQQLMRSITMVARLLPAAFAAATISSIANTAKALLDLDAAAIKSGESIQTISKLSEIFKAIGASADEASNGIEAFFASIDKAKIDEVTKAVQDIKKELATGWFGWEGFKTLERLAQGAGKAAELAREKLKELGREIPTDPITESIQKILASTADAAQKFEQLMVVFSQMGDAAKRNAAILNTFGDAMGTLIIQGIRAGLTLSELTILLGQIPPASQAAADAAIRLRLAWQQFKNLIMSGFEVSPEGLNQIAFAIENLIAGMKTVGETVRSVFGGDLLTNTIREFQTLAQLIGYVEIGLRAVFGSDIFDNTKRELQTIGNLLESLGRIGFSAMKYVEAGAVEAWRTIVGWVNKAVAAAKEFFNLRGGDPATGAGAEVMARGGFVGGRGTGTSDSNLAWLSRGEHVMPAYAVRQPGVLQLLEALRRSGGNLRGVLDRMGHFALGGLVGAPAFAAGGVNGMNHVTIAFPGLPAIGGLRASSAVVDDLRRAAALAQVRSGGRKPSRYS